MLATEHQLHPPGPASHTPIAAIIFHTTLKYVQSVSLDNVVKYFQHRPRVATTNLFTNGQASLVLLNSLRVAIDFLHLHVRGSSKPNATASSLFARRTLNYTQETTLFMYVVQHVISQFDVHE